MVWSSTGVVGIICRVLFIAKNITAAIFQYLCVIKIFFPTLGQPNTLWPSNQIIKSVRNRPTNWSFKVNIQPLQSKKNQLVNQFLTILLAGVRVSLGRQSRITTEWIPLLLHTSPSPPSSSFGNPTPSQIFFLLYSQSKQDRNVGHWVVQFFHYHMVFR